ncbi:MAG TPA: histidine kinase [Vicinamibacterales bacterium]|nr:histidine kinase [Vicinamibacterales bacterium]
MCARSLRLAALLIVTAWIAPAPADAQPAKPRLPVLSTVSAIRALSQDEGARGYPVDVRATVTHIDERGHSTLFIHDGALGQFVMPPTVPASVPAWAELRQGDLVEIEGRTERGGFAPNIRPSAVHRLGHASLPRPKQIPLAALLTGRHDCDYIEIAGVIQRAWRSSDPQMHTLFADVAYDDGIVRATFWDYSDADARRFVDARVRLRGNVGTLFGSTEQLRGVSLFVGRTSDIVVLEPAPDPFALPARSIRSLYNYSAAGEVNRRIRVRGVVTGYRPGRPIEVRDFTSNARFRYVGSVLYVDDGTGGVRIETEDEYPLHAGSSVDVAGFPAVTPGKPILRNAVVKIAGTGTPPRPLRLAETNLLTPDNDAMLVRMQGHLLSVLTNPAQRTFVVKVGETVFDADLDTAAPSALDDLRSGSLVAVTGVYAYEFGSVPSFRLLLRSPDDLELVSAARWWTMRHTGVMAVILGVGAWGVVIWSRASGRRKRQEYQAVLNERTRVGRELHDTLEQGLSGIALQLEAVSATLQTSPAQAQQSLDVARQMLRYSLEETRRSVLDLRSQALERGDLAGALSDMARQMTVGTRATAHFRVEGTPRRLDASHEHHLLRIGLEALTNALKHSGASRIDIVIRFQADSTTLVVQDDGCGIGQKDADLSSRHFGLQGIRERVDKLGGALSIENAADGGTRVAVTVPAHRPGQPGVLAEATS